MDLTNESYTIVIHINHGKATERYFKDSRHAHDKKCWMQVSTRGNEFRATAEQVLNHLLPALAGLKPGITVEVEHHPRQAVEGRCVAVIPSSLNS
jgi:hypothetical protein